MRPVYNVLVLCLALASGFPGPNRQVTLHDPVPAEDDFGPRIYNGDDAKEGEFPFMVRLLFNGFQCGGSLITKNVVLTAGHCVVKKNSAIPLKPESMQAVLGDFTGGWDKHEQYIQASKIILHSKYNKNNYENDIALVMINGSAYNKGGKVGTIKLPPAEMKSKLYTPGAPITVIGWGGTEKSQAANTLQKLTYNIASTAECKKFWGNNLHEGNICTHMKGKPLTKHSWGGDSGGPLFTSVNDTSYVLALVSFGVNEPDTRALDVNTDVSDYLGWIEENLKANGEGTDKEDKDKEDKDKEDKDKEDKDKEDKDKEDKDKEDKDKEDKDPSKYKLQLGGGLGPNEGIIFIQHPDLKQGVNHAVCNDKFSRNNVMAVCRQLGYKYGKLRGPGVYLDRDILRNSKFSFTNLECKDNATNVFHDCKLEKYSAAGAAPCFNGDQAAVSCSNEIFEFKFESSHHAKYLRNNQLMKVRSLCKITARKYGQPIWPAVDFKAGVVNVKSDGKVEVLVDHMKYKSRRGFFVRTFRKEISFESEEDAKKNTCLAVVIYLNHTPGVFKTQIDSSHCGAGAEKAEGAIKQWAKEQSNKES